MPASLISLIIPCFNEEAIIDETVGRLKNVMEKSEHNFEIIFINDGSTDQTLTKLEKHCASDKRFKVISFSRNFGHQPAISAGICFAKGDAAIIMDADLQDPPEIIPEMIHTWQEQKCNVVFALRRRRNQETFFKKITAKIYYRLINSLSDFPLPLDTGDFRLIDRKVIDAFNRLHEKQKYIRGLISWIGFKQVPFWYDRDERVGGSTKFSVIRMISFARIGLVYFTRRPLRLATQLGLLSCIVGLGLITYVLISRICYPQTTIRGWSSLLIAVVFFGGVQLITIGLLGEYIAGIFDEVKSRPEYITDRTINFE